MHVVVNIRMQSMQYLLLLLISLLYSAFPLKMLASFAAPHDIDGNAANTNPPPWKVAMPSTVREMTQYKNKVPFHETTYQIIHETIALLAKRLSKYEDGERVLLSADEALWFASAVEEIIADAHRYGPPEKPLPPVM